MSSKDPKVQATKFLQQLRVLEAERLALYDELLDPDSRALQEQFDRFKVEFATTVREVRQLRNHNVKLRAQLEEAGLDESAPAASTKNQLKTTLFEVRRKLRKGYSGEALDILEKRLGQED